MSLKIHTPSLSQPDNVVDPTPDLKEKTAARMIHVIRQAIIDKDVMQCLTSQDLSAMLRNVADSLTPTDVRGFIYRCVSNKEPDKGLIMADRAIDFALEMREAGEEEIFSDIVSAAVGTLSMMSANTPTVKEKITALLNHPHPDVVVSVIENLGHTSNIDNFNRVADLILQPNQEVATAACVYVEACARDAAFRKRRELYVIESAAEEFLRGVLLRLERIYSQIKPDRTKPRDIARRLAILVAMIYNEVLDSTDWKRFRKEEVDERIYYALEQHLQDKIAPDATAYLFQLLESPTVENGIKRSALHTLGRLSKRRGVRDRMLDWVPRFIAATTSEELVSTATHIFQACQSGKPFSVLLCLPGLHGPPSSMVPRSAGAPLRLRITKKRTDSD